jgi:DNA-binding NtrC family response regulator
VREAMRLLDTRPFDLIITDLDLEPSNGLAILKRTEEATFTVMIYTGNSDVTYAIRPSGWADDTY